MCEREIDINITEQALKLLSSDYNKYFLARFLEISSLLDYLLKEGALRKKNFDGNITDLGTGSGIGMLALRQFTHGELTGIDNVQAWSDINPYTGYYYEIPHPKIVEAASAAFKSFDILDYLDLYGFCAEQSKLVTAFYVDFQGWCERLKTTTGYDMKRCLTLIFEEIGDVLPPGGQFLLTFDRNWAEHPSWTDNEIAFRGTEGRYKKTLQIPFPDWLKAKAWHIVLDVRFSDRVPRL